VKSTAPEITSSEYESSPCTSSSDILEYQDLETKDIKDRQSTKRAKRSLNERARRNKEKEWKRNHKL
jgi:hypothetical protein